jgi:hypothetical protein
MTFDEANPDLKPTGEEAGEFVDGRTARFGPPSACDD